MRPTRLTFVDVLPVPYRTPFYRLLHEDPAYDLRVLFCAGSHAHRSWTGFELDFPHRILRGPRVTLGTENLVSYHLNPGAVRDLLVHRPDAVVVCGWAQPTFWLAAASARLLRLPYLVNSESHGGRARGRVGRLARSAVFERVVRGAAASLATGSRAREYLVQLGAEPESVFLLPNSCDIDAIAVAADAARDDGRAARLRRRLADGRPLVVFAGRLLPVKDVDVLLRALALLRDQGAEPALAVAGEGRERAALERLAGELGLAAVSFLGAVAPERLPELYAAGDAFCLPSHDETWGVVVNEAMAAGLPVVVSEAAGSAADLVVPGRTGETFPAGDIDRLAAALVEVLARARELGAGARKHVRGWGYDAGRQGLADALRHAGVGQ